jgi:hypothetical protein
VGDGELKQWDEMIVEFHERFRDTFGNGSDGGHSLKMIKLMINKKKKDLFLDNTLWAL